MKKVLRYAMDDFLKYVERYRSVIDMSTDRRVECDIVAQMDDDTYRVLIGDYLYDAFFSDDDIMYTKEDGIYLSNLGTKDIETRIKDYNKRLYLQDEQYGYINAIYFLGEIEAPDESFVEESHEKTLKEIEDSEEPMSTLEMCERLMDSYDRVSNAFIEISR